MIPDAIIPPTGRPAYLKPDNSYDLLFPVVYHEGEEKKLLERLKLRRLTGHEKILAEGSGTPTERTVEILASITNEMALVLRKIDWVDLDRLEECVGFFTDAGQTTGAIF
mgnify:CR=1 FL=1